MIRCRTSTMVCILTVTLTFGAATAGCDNNEKAVPTVLPPVKSERTATPVISDSPRVEGLRLHVDQVGYLPESPKTLVVAADEPFAAMTVQVVAKGGDEPVWEGMLPAAKADENSGDWVARADFEALATDGAYEAVAGGNRSAPFLIGDDVFDDVWTKVARSYTAQRASFEQDDPFTGLKLLAGHKQDKEARLFFKDEGHPSVVDVSGGWYDAGDYGKYVPTAAITVGQLLAAFELDPITAAAPFLTERETAFWPAAPQAPHLLAEAKYELDWMLRMQRRDGAVYHKVSAMSFPAYILPAEDLQDRYVFGLSTFGTALFAGAAAMGARIFEPYDSAYAEKLLDRAMKAQAWLSEHPDAYFRFDEGQDTGSGPYSKPTDREERLWALAELFKTTGDGKYEAYILRDYADMLGKPPGTVSWNNAQLLGQWALATAEKKPSAVRDEAATAIAQAADVIVGRIGEDDYRSSLAANEYKWGSNQNALANAEVLLLANRLKPSKAYANGALEQLHYVLGRNAMGMSYITGVGSRYPLKVHHRISLMSGVKVPGLMVGGPNKFGGDQTLAKVIEQGAFPAKSYIDDESSYASNEYAIDYNAPLLFVLTEFRSQEAD